MTTVAGVRFQDLWAWKCPGWNCRVRMLRDDERALAAEASAHYLEEHGPSVDQLEMPFEESTLPPPVLRAV